MAAPEKIDEFDRFLANEDRIEKYLSLGLAFEEVLEKLRTSGFEAEKQALEKVLELSQARGQLIELGAKRLLDGQRHAIEQAFLRDPHNLVQPFRAVLKEHREELEALVRSATAERQPPGRSPAAKFGLALLVSAILVGAVLIVLHQLGLLNLDLSALWGRGRT